jgi:hypothetical protein
MIQGRWLDKGIWRIEVVLASDTCLVRRLDLSIFGGFSPASEHVE